MDEVAHAARSLMSDSALERLRDGNPSRWPCIAATAQRSRDKMASLLPLVSGQLPTDEGSLIVFGSLARGEFTEGSDLDWTIIIDGRADSRHLELALSVKSKLEEAKFVKPGPTGVFGGLVFSHDLIHAIGGDEDTNRNMTRRLLLLLESASVDFPESKEVHSRIIAGILNRYVQEDASFIASNRHKNRIPRFLLNDVVRFWRTMAVDYANKYRARAGDGWALRNIKLRMSRKLLFVSGLFMCISWALDYPETTDEAYLEQKLVEHLQNWTRRRPLENLALVVEKYAPHLTNDLFDEYEHFLTLLDNNNDREILKSLRPDDAYINKLFLGARDSAIRFDEALVKLLFSSNETVTALSKKYGIF